MQRTALITLSKNMRLRRSWIAQVSCEMIQRGPPGHAPSSLWCGTPCLLGCCNPEHSRGDYFIGHVRNQNAGQGRRRPGQHQGQLRLEAQTHNLCQTPASQVPLYGNVSKRQVLQAGEGIDKLRSDEQLMIILSLDAQVLHRWEH